MMISRSRSKKMHQTRSKNQSRTIRKRAPTTKTHQLHSRRQKATSKLIKVRQRKKVPGMQKTTYRKNRHSIRKTLRKSQMTRETARWACTQRAWCSLPGRSLPGAACLVQRARSQRTWVQRARSQPACTQPAWCSPPGRPRKGGRGTELLDTPPYQLPDWSA